jgi:hypothetical protein
MLSRPAVQQQEIRFAPHKSAIYSSWTPAQFYLAFRLDGFEAGSAAGWSNFVDYQFGRAWGEDVCEVLMQPVYPDGSLGPLVQVTCKPYQVQVFRRLDPRLNAAPWQPLAGVDIRYQGTLRDTIWRGELAIPWDALNDPAHAGRKPAFLRFNFIEHRAGTGQSASWAGPIDHDREENFTGLLEIRRAESAGFADRPSAP